MIESRRFFKHLIPIIDSHHRFHWQLRVYYEDTDSGGVVYYANYLRFIERARTEWLRSLGFEQEALKRDEGIVFAVRSVNIEFLQPAWLDDRLDISVILTGLKPASFVLQNSVSRIVADHTADCLVAASVKVACLNIECFKPAPIPAPIRLALAQVMQRAG
jgi:acyl-CoA thioester hydrolase